MQCNYAIYTETIAVINNTQTSPFCSKTLVLFRLCHDHVRKYTRLSTCVQFVFRDPATSALVFRPTLSFASPAAQPACNKHRIFSIQGKIHNLHVIAKVLQNSDAILFGANTLHVE